jgi:hypothetical protein
MLDLLLFFFFPLIFFSEVKFLGLALVGVGLAISNVG